MEEIKLKSVSHWHQIASDHKKNFNKFRGQSDADWDLVPKAGREPFNKVDDKVIFDQWKRRACYYLGNKNYNEWELLSIAQHTGLPTRLLDWSHYSSVALFFCCTSNLDKDGAVFIYPADSYVVTKNNNPFTIKTEGAFYQPATSINRMASQGGYFSIHKNPQKPFDFSSKYGELIKIIVPHRLKQHLLEMLNQYGINYLSLFPDLEGLSNFLTWFYSTGTFVHDLEYKM